MKLQDPYFANRRPPPPLKAKVGDRVSYTRYFLKCIGVPATDEMWFKRGTVTKLDDWKAYVLWDGEEESRPVNLANLAIPGPNLAFCE